MNEPTRTFLENALQLALINLLGLIALAPFPMLLFTDIWSIQHSDESDIVARGPWIAGLFLVPSFIIISLFILVISFLQFRKQYFYEILAGWLLSLHLFVLVFFTPLSEIVYIPSKVLGIIYPLLRYIYFALLIFVYVRLLRKKKACSSVEDSA